MLTFFTIERPDDGELAAVEVGDLDGLLDAVDVRREAGHEHATVGLGEDAVERLADLALRARAALALDVGGVGEQGEDALLAELRELVDVGRAPVDRGVVELVIA